MFALSRLPAELLKEVAIHVDLGLTWESSTHGADDPPATTLRGTSSFSTPRAGPKKPTFVDKTIFCGNSYVIALSNKRLDQSGYYSKIYAPVTESPFYQKYRWILASYNHIGVCDLTFLRNERADIPATCQRYLWNEIVEIKFNGSKHQASQIKAEATRTPTCAFARQTILLSDMVDNKCIKTVTSSGSTSS
jgi:hypothetical protein